MKAEIQAAAAWWASQLKNKSSPPDPTKHTRFQEYLEQALLDKFEGHWYPDEPTRGSALRAISYDVRMDTVLQQAALQSGIDRLTRKLLHVRWVVMFVNPGVVKVKNVVTDQEQMVLLCQTTSDGDVHTVEQQQHVAPLSSAEECEDSESAAPSADWGFNALDSSSCASSTSAASQSSSPQLSAASSTFNSNASTPTSSSVPTQPDSSEAVARLILDDLIHQDTLEQQQQQQRGQNPVSNCPSSSSSSSEGTLASSSAGDRPLYHTNFVQTSHPFAATVQNSNQCIA